MSLRQLAVFACLLAAPATGFAQEKKAELSSSDKALIKAVRDNGGQALQLAQNDARITVAFHLSDKEIGNDQLKPCLLYTSPSPRDRQKSRMPSSA